MDANIRINMGEAEDAFTGIELAIVTKLMTKQTAYGDILLLFTKSEGEQVEALKEMIVKEQEAVKKLTELYSAVVRMLRDASKSFERTESNYSVSKVEM